MNAYDFLLRGQAHMHKVTREDATKALGCFEQAIALDPNYGRAYAFASWYYRRDVQERGLEAVPQEYRQKSVDLARNALRCDRNDPLILAYAACTSLYVERDFDEALELMDRAVSMNPNSHRSWNGKAQVHSFRGETLEAIEAGKRAIAISPNNSAIWSIHWMNAQAYLQELRYKEAAECAKRATRQNEDLGPAYFILAATSAHLGRKTDTREALAAALKINPGMTVEKLPKCYPLSRLKNLNAYLDGLREAGLPE
jgi:adenylate cyclase